MAVSNSLELEELLTQMLQLSSALYEESEGAKVRDVATHHFGTTIGNLTRSLQSLKDLAAFMPIHLSSLNTALSQYVSLCQELTFPSADPLSAEQVTETAERIKRKLSSGGSASLAVSLNLFAATMQIVIEDIKLNNRVTVDALEQQLARIEKAITDLSNRLKSVQGEIKRLSRLQQYEGSAETYRFDEERKAIESSLVLCAEALSRAKDIKHRSLRDRSFLPSSSQQDVIRSRGHPSSQQPAATDLYPNRVNTYHQIDLSEDVDNVIISTDHYLFDIRHLKVGSGSRHWFGQMSDESLQQMLSDRRTAAADFEGRHGRGRILS